MKNKLKRVLAEGRTAVGAWVCCSDPYGVEIMADAGFDWLLVDMEHIPMGKETLRTILMSCKGSESTQIVRVPANASDYIPAALDLGAHGIMVPMVNSAADARKATNYTRYPPLGCRGFGPTRAGSYSQLAEQYREEANEEIALFLQIETPEAVQNAREIFQTDGIDGIFIGNADLVNFMSHGHAGSAAVERVIDDLIQMAVGFSMPIGLPTWSPEELRKYARSGAQLLTLGSDIEFMSTGARRRLTDARQLLELPGELAAQSTGSQPS